MQLVSEDGNELHLFGVQPGEEWFACDAYIALYDAYEGDVFVGRDPEGKRVPIRTAQDLHAGLNLYPGDPTCFNQLSEPPLFQQLPD